MKVAVSSGQYELGSLEYNFLWNKLNLCLMVFILTSGGTNGETFIIQYTADENGFIAETFSNKNQTKLALSTPKPTSKPTPKATPKPTPKPIKASDELVTPESNTAADESVESDELADASVGSQLPETVNADLGVSSSLSNNRPSVQLGSRNNSQLSIQQQIQNLLKNSAGPNFDSNALTELLEKLKSSNCTNLTGQINNQQFVGLNGNPPTIVQTGGSNVQSSGLLNTQFGNGNNQFIGGNQLLTSAGIQSNANLNIPAVQVQSVNQNFNSNSATISMQINENNQNPDYSLPATSSETEVENNQNPDYSSPAQIDTENYQISDNNSPFVTAQIPDISYPATSNQVGNMQVTGSISPVLSTQTGVVNNQMLPSVSTPGTNNIQNPDMSSPTASLQTGAGVSPSVQVDPSTLQSVVYGTNNRPVFEGNLNNSLKFATQIDTVNL